MNRVMHVAGSVLLLSFLSLLWIGCRPLAGGSGSETKELNFQRGRHDVRMGDYPAAIESFEKALQVNPNSGEAHFELGRIFSQNIKDPAPAIYHLQRFVNLAPSDGRKDTANRFILSMKQELARSVSLSTVQEHVENELVQLQSENDSLKQESARLNQEVAQLQAQLQRIEQSRQLVENVPDLNRRPVVPDAGRRQTSRRIAQAPTRNPFKEYVVKKDDTLYDIARRHKVDVKALERANPRVNPSKMMPGDPIRIPRS